MGWEAFNDWELPLVLWGWREVPSIPGAAGETHPKMSRARPWTTTYLVIVFVLNSAVFRGSL